MNFTFYLENRLSAKMSVLLETTMGDLVIDLYTESRPRCCVNFLKLCKAKYYKHGLHIKLRHGILSEIDGRATLATNTSTMCLYPPLVSYWKGWRDFFCWRFHQSCSVVLYASIVIQWFTKSSVISVSNWVTRLMLKMAKILKMDIQYFIKCTEKEPDILKPKHYLEFYTIDQGLFQW